MAKKRYRVLAEDSNVLGHSSGEEFEADLDEGYNVEALIASGALEEVGAKKPSKAEGKEQ